VGVRLHPRASPATVVAVVARSELIAAAAPKSVGSTGGDLDRTATTAHPESRDARAIAVQSAQSGSTQARAEGEQRRWVHLFGLDAVPFCASLIALFATGIEWFVLPMLISAPIAGALTLVYLAVSSDVNVEIARVGNRTSGPPISVALGSATAALAQSRGASDDGSHDRRRRWETENPLHHHRRRAMSLRFVPTCSSCSRAASSSSPARRSPPAPPAGSASASLSASSR